MKGREFSGMVGMVTLMRIHASRAQYVTISGGGASMTMSELRYGDRVKWGNEGSDRRGWRFPVRTIGNRSEEFSGEQDLLDIVLVA